MPVEELRLASKALDCEVMEGTFSNIVDNGYEKLCVTDSEKRISFEFKQIRQSSQKMNNLIYNESDEENEGMDRITTKTKNSDEYKSENTISFLDTNFNSQDIRNRLNELDTRNSERKTGKPLHLNAVLFFFLPQ